ncbi:MAG: PhoPQ-activated protein PqaA family protein [Verrucomicrobiota bacterium]
MKLFRALPALCLLLLTAGARPVKADLKSWLDRPEPDFKWELTETIPMPACDIHRLKLVSQVWQGITWKHDLVVFAPRDAAPTDQILLLNEGGSANPKGYPYGLLLASKIKAPCAMLLGIPNQPLFDGKKEDGLIAETFVKYLETGDETWPLLFPMVKSVIKSMDTLQAFSEKHLSRKVERFILAGGSKRGWNTYLTAASDKRVSAIAPMVFDSLNMAEQLPHQKEIYGGYSKMIDDYISRGLVPMPDTVSAKKLWSWVDPWFYRERLTMPKLILAGANDPYWNTDALNFYWDGLPDQKWIAYIPNAGHSLNEKSPETGKSDRFRAIDGLCAFVRHQLTGQAMPRMTWHHDDAADGQSRLTVTCSPAPKTATLWTAAAAGRDFRQSAWQPKTLEIPADGKITALVAKPATGGQAFYIDCGYPVDDLTSHLCTQLRVTAAKTVTASSGAASAAAGQ